MPAYHVDHVSKTFGETVAVNDVSLDVQEGRGLRLSRAKRVRQDHPCG